MKQKAGTVILKGKNYDLKEAGPDHPIYRRGFRVGMTSTSSSSKNTQETPSPKSKTTKGKKKEKGAT